MKELHLYRSIAEARALVREGLGIESAAKHGCCHSGGDPQYVALQAAEAEIRCAQIRAALAQAALRRRGITLMESDEDEN